MLKILFHSSVQVHDVQSGLDSSRRSSRGVGIDEGAGSACG